jgi:tyrosyl-tRNA synthetase
MEYPAGGLAEKIRRHGRLRVKLGVDPTAPRVTWGWGVNLRRLRRAQELGHTAVLIVGDFTAQVGDPSSRSSTRRRLSKDEVEGFVISCLAALQAILSKENLEIRRNSEWLAAMGMEGVLSLSAQATVAQLLDRDDFSRRFLAHEPISVLELLYPLLQAQDSVEVRADVELGGNDQYFNLLLARALQPREGQEPQVAWCSPLLVGTDGQKKMSQSLGNYIGVDEDPEGIFGKAMSIPDEAMSQYLTLATDLRPAEAARLLGQGLEPVALKRLIAREMVALFHGSDAAGEAEAAFEAVHVRHEAPLELDQKETSERYLPRILFDLGWVGSLSDGRRAIAEGGVRLDGTVVTDLHAELAPGTCILQRGRRRFIQLTVSQA